MNLTPEGDEVVKHVKGGKKEGWLAFAALGVIVTLGAISLWSELKRENNERGRG